VGRKQQLATSSAVAKTPTKHVFLTFFFEGKTYVYYTSTVPYKDQYTTRTN